MLKLIILTIAWIGIAVTTEATRADTVNNSTQSKMNHPRKDLTRTKLKKTIIYQSTLDSQIFSNQNSNLKPLNSKQLPKTNKNVPASGTAAANSNCTNITSDICIMPAKIEVYGSPTNAFPSNSFPGK